MPDHLGDEKTIRRVIIPYLRRNHSDALDLDQVTDDEIVGACLSVLGESGPALRHPAELILDFVYSLPLPNATDTQWRLGRRELADWYRSSSLIERTRGRPDAWQDRILVFAYVEWLVQMHEENLETGVARAASLFEIPISTLERWIIDKHSYADERRTARELIGIYRLFSKGSEQEQLEFLAEKAPFLFDPKAKPQ